ncbi:MAG: hypothetical protein IKG21_11395 [Atopobiaceae bacterium]|nr:hypothetical protein [Atopobiaceae bacterium]
MTNLELQKEPFIIRLLSYVPRGVWVVLSEGLALVFLGLVTGILSSVADVVFVGKAAFITRFALWALLNALVAIHVDSRLKAIWWAVPFNLGYMESYYISTAASYEGFGKALVVPLAGIALASPFLAYALWTAKRDRGPYGKILSVLIAAGVVGASYYLYGTYDVYSIVVSVILLLVLLFWPARRFKFVPAQRPTAPVEASAEAEVASELGAELGVEKEITPSNVSRSELLAEVPSIEEEESAPTLRRRRRVTDDGPLRRTRTEYGFEYATERRSGWYQDDSSWESEREREREEQTARNTRGKRSGRNGRSVRDARVEQEERDLRRSRNRDDRSSRSSIASRTSSASRDSRELRSSRTSSSERDSYELRRSRSSRDSRGSRDSLRSQRPTRRVGSSSSARPIARPSSRRYRQRHDEREREANRREATRRRAQRERTTRERTTRNSTRESTHYAEGSSYTSYLESSNYSSSISTLGTARSARPSHRTR